MKKMLTNNLGLKLLSIVSAVMLWLIVVNIDDPVTYQEFSSIRVAMLNEDAVTDKDQVYRVEDNSDLINIRVWAKRSVLDKLSAEDFTATADMEKNIKFGNLVGIEVSCSNRNVRTADITKSRENVVISIEDAASELFNVVVKQSGQADDAYVVGTALPEQSLIEIRGPASVVARINLRPERDLCADDSGQQRGYGGYHLSGIRREDGRHERKSNHAEKERRKAETGIYGRSVRGLQFQKYFCKTGDSEDCRNYGRYFQSQ